MPRRGRRCRRERRQRHGDGGLAPGRSLVRTGVEDLDVDQARHEEQHGHHEDQPDQPHPALEGAALPATTRARDREPATFAGGRCGRWRGRAEGGTRQRRAGGRGRRAAGGLDGRDGRAGAARCRVVVADDVGADARRCSLRVPGCPSGLLLASPPRPKARARRGSCRVVTLMASTSAGWSRRAGRSPRRACPTPPGARARSGGGGCRRGSGCGRHRRGGEGHGERDVGQFDDAGRPDHLELSWWRPTRSGTASRVVPRPVRPGGACSAPA